MQPIKDKTHPYGRLILENMVDSFIDILKKQKTPNLLLMEKTETHSLVPKTQKELITLCTGVIQMN